MSTIDRSTFLTALSLAKSALATQAFVPAYTHFLLSDDRVVAYNDQVGVSIGMQHDLEACLPGDLLIRALNSLPGSNVLVQAHASEAAVVLSAGRSKLKVPSLSVKDFPIKWPKLNQMEQVTLSVDVLNGIRQCLPNVSTNANHPAQMGVTLDVDNQGVAVLWSTDGYTLSQYATESPIDLPGDAAVILPTPFCEQLLALGKAFPNEDAVVFMQPGVLVAQFGSKARVMARTLVDTQPLDFATVKGRHVQQAGDFVDIPPGWEDALQRALVVLAPETAKTATLAFTRGELRFSATSAMGQAEDVLDFAGKGLSKDASVDPSMLLRGSKNASQLAFTPTATLLRSADESFFHMVAHCAR